MRARSRVGSPRPLYRWTRDLHLYVGLFISPFVLVYALTAIIFNHALASTHGGAGEEAATRRVVVTVPDEENSLEIARKVREQIGVAGEIGWIDLKPAENRLSFPIEKPGEMTRIRVDLATGAAEIEERKTGVWEAMVFLHKMPGPHNVMLRGNWIFTRLWGWLADATAYLLLFVSASGIYLWSVLRAERRAGLVFLGTGILSFVLLVVAIAA